MAKKQLGVINITNQENETAEIDIEGIIGIPEWWQFDNTQDRISTFNKFKDTISQIKNIKAKNIKVNIRSLGGNVNHALMIHDSLCEINANVTTICYGYTASAATIIAQAAGKGNRKISSNSLYLPHQSAIFVGGTIKDLQEAIKLLERTNKTIVQIYANRGGFTIEYYEEIINKNEGRGEWLTADEVFQHKFADEVIQVTGATNLDISMIENFGYPEVPENKLLYFARDEIVT